MFFDIAGKGSRAMDHCGTTKRLVDEKGKDHPNVVRSLAQVTLSTPILKTGNAW